MMPVLVASHIMSRTTLNIDDTVLRELKRLQEQDPRPLGELASELLATALAQRGEDREEPQTLGWRTEDMSARVDLEDREAVQRLLDESEG